MALKRLFTTNLIILARRLNNLHDDLDNTFTLDSGQFLSRRDHMKLKTMQRRIDKDIATVEIITHHFSPATDIPKLAPSTPSSDPIADKDHSKKSLAQTRHFNRPK